LKSKPSAKTGKLRAPLFFFYSRSFSRPLLRVLPLSSSRPRVLFLNRSYWPDAEATGQLLTELCESLASSFQVAVIPGQPNKNLDRVEYLRGGIEQRNGVEIRRVRHTQFDKSNLVARACNYVTYLLMTAWRSLWVSKVDILVTETDPFMLPLWGRWLRHWHRCKWICYLQDIHPDVGVAIGKLRWNGLTRWLRNRLTAAYQRADHVIVLSEDMRTHLLSRGLKSERISVIHNWADVDSLIPQKRDNPFRVREKIPATSFLVMYSGNLGLTQRLDQILEAAELLLNRSEILFYFVGDGAEAPRLKEETRQRGLTNVVFRPYQPKTQLGESLSAADVQIIVLQSSLVPLLMPSKLYGVLASGTCSIVVAPIDSHLARIVQDDQTGIVIANANAAEIADSIRSLADNPAFVIGAGERARRVAEDRYQRRCSSEQFHAVCQQLLASA
jgi:colanic acid biosynthesis glycosyl transferase WcaI